MTMSGYSNAIVDVMLGWLKGFANWVLRLFNLAGSTRTSPLLWLSQNWMKLLIFFLLLGIIVDIVIWLIRWRPHWVWFRRERIIVNDDEFFRNADMDKAGDSEEALEDNWDEHDYVVASTVVKRRPAKGGRSAASHSAKRATPGKQKSEQPVRRSTKVRRHTQDSTDEDRQPAKVQPRRAQDKQKERDKTIVRDQRTASGEPDNIFTGKLKRQGVADSYEDEVFDVSSLPASGERKSRKKAGKK